MSESSNPYYSGEQSGGPVPGLQRSIHVGDGVSLHALPSGVHVSCNSSAAVVYGVR